METKTETLADVLRDLCDLAPERFNLEDNNWIYVFRWGSWRRASLIGRLDEDRIVGACQEECGAREWRVQLRIDPDGTRATISTIVFNDSILGAAFADSPALAIATALRDALKAE